MWYFLFMPRKIRDLRRDLLKAGCEEVMGKGSHRKYKYKGLEPVILPYKPNDDAKRYLEEEVKGMLEEIRQLKQEG